MAMKRDRGRERLKEAIKIARVIKNMDCSKADDELECAVTVADFKTELAALLDSLFFRMAFTWNTHTEMRNDMDKLAEIFIKHGLLTEIRWEEIKNAVLDYIRYVINPRGKMVAKMMKTPAVRELLMNFVDTVEMFTLKNKEFVEKYVNRDNQDSAE